MKKEGFWVLQPQQVFFVLEICQSPTVKLTTVSPEIRFILGPAADSINNERIDV